MLLGLMLASCVLAPLACGVVAEALFPSRGRG